MPAKSQKQQKFFGLVRAVQTGATSPHEVSPEIRKIASKITAKDAGDFASSVAELRTKRAMLALLKELQEPMNLQEDDGLGQKTNAIASTFNVKDNYEVYVKKHLGQPLLPKELEAIDNFQESKPTKIERTEIRYENTDSFSNSTTTVIKKMKDNGQFSFNAFTKHSKPEPQQDEEPTDSPEVPPSNGPGAPAPQEPQPPTPTANDKDDIIVSKSQLFTDDIKGGAILADFLKKLDL